jgi:hypothetical protein
MHSNLRKTRKIKTNLYDLITAINDEIRVGEEGLVIQVLQDLMNRRCLKFI